MKSIRIIIILVMSLFGLLMCTNSYANTAHPANISFIISKDFPKHFYCHFRAYRWASTYDIISPIRYQRGGWSSKHHAGSTYHQGGSGLDKVVVSCFDDRADEKILPIGHICFPINKHDHSTVIVSITHSGSQILFNGAPPVASKAC